MSDTNPRPECNQVWFLNFRMSSMFTHLRFSSLCRLYGCVVWWLKVAGENGVGLPAPSLPTFANRLGIRPDINVLQPARPILQRFGGRFVSLFDRAKEGPKKRQR